MRRRLDTHAFIWHREGSSLLSTRARSAIGTEGNSIFISAVTLWEISIKVSLGKLKLSKPLRELLAIYTNGGAELLPITPEHAMAVENLPWHHRDPFDRMLIAQVQQENLTLVTQDDLIRQYQVAWIW